MKFRTIENSNPLFSAAGFQFITVKSNALKSRVDVSVFVPEQAKNQSGIPVYVMLHGVYGSHWAWALKGGAHKALQDLINQDKVLPAVLVMPSDGLWGDGSGYVNHEGKNFEAWIGEELPELIKQEINSVDESSNFYIGGLSMGGYGAFRIGLKFQQIYKGISGHSSMTSLNQMPLFVEEDWSSKLENIKDKSILDCLNIVENKHIPIRFDCGTEDELRSFNRNLHKAFLQKNIDHIYEEFPGGHSWEYWQEHVQRSFLFFHELELNNNH